MTANIFENPFGENFKLERYPINEKLKAWDSADELIVQELNKNRELNNKKILILNDSFGALSFALKNFNPVAYTDSFVSNKAMVGLNKDIQIVNDLTLLEGNFDLVLVKIPKSLSFFEDMLAKLSQILSIGTPIIFGCMVKYLTKGYFDLIEKYIGVAKTSLAQKKARLVFASISFKSKVSPYPQSVYVEPLKMEFLNHSNVFSRHRRDVGTRFFLNHIPKGDFKTILDLGSGNGVIGIQAKLMNTKSKIIFTDDSFMAIKSSRENSHKLLPQNDSSFFWMNCYEGANCLPLDLVLCNPPFHQNNTVGDFIALKMFEDAKKSLIPGGRIRVIGNTHLGYHMRLKSIFGNSKIIARNIKFMVVDAIKQ